MSVTTGGALTVTGAGMITLSSNQMAGISSPPVSTSCPFDISRTLTQPRGPNIEKPIRAIYPDPLTPPAPSGLNATRIVSASMKRQLTIGTVVPPMFPASTSVTFTKRESNERSNCPEPRAATWWISIVALNEPDITSGALTLTCIIFSVGTEYSSNGSISGQLSPSELMR